MVEGAGTTFLKLAETSLGRVKFLMQALLVIGMDMNQWTFLLSW